MGETCVVELRYASNGAYYGAFAADDGSLVARSRAFDRDDRMAAAEALGEVRFAVTALGRCPTDTEGRAHRRGAPPAE